MMKCWCFNGHIFHPLKNVGDELGSSVCVCVCVCLRRAGVELRVAGLGMAPRF